MILIKRIIVLSLVALSFSASAALSKEPKVVTSIKPIHSLASRIMGDKGELEVLVSGGLTPHIFRMKPSDFKKVVEADVLFYISPKFETFLQSASIVERSSLNAMAFAEQEGMKLYPYRDSKVWYTEEEEHAHEINDRHHDHDHGDMDLHIWLDPSNARRMVDIIKDTLSEIDPANSFHYGRNAQLLKKELYEQEELIRELLRPLRDSAMIVYHDAFQYYERAYALSSMGAVQLRDDEPPSVKHLAALKRIAEEKNVACVLAIPGTHPRIAMAVMGELDIGYSVVDHLGEYLEEGPESYQQLVFAITQSILDCHEKDDNVMFGDN